MAQVRLLVPYTDDKGKQHSPGDVINVDDETFNALRADGKATSTAEEKAAEDRSKEGNYDARTSRADAGHEAVTEEPKPEAKKKS